MTLPVSGTIAMSQVNTELGLTSTTNISLNQSTVRTLAGIASGTISLNSLHGKSNRVALSVVFSTNTANASVAIQNVTGYVAGRTDLTITVNSGVYLYGVPVISPAATGHGLYIFNGAAAGDTITLINNGYIMGGGGTGGSYDYNSITLISATAGGPALRLTYPITLVNNSYIAGGGGGGGNGFSAGGGGGAGGGFGGSQYQTLGRNAIGGTPGNIGAAANASTNPQGGGAGGRILPGVGGAAQSVAVSPAFTYAVGLGGGAGGSGGGSTSAANGGSFTTGAGGSGSGVGSNATVNADTLAFASGGGGGWGAAGGSGAGYSTTSWPPGAAGAGGSAIQLNGNTVTYTTTGTIYGAVA